MANATLPQIIIAFKSLAQSFITRSERGIAILITREDGETVDGDYVEVTPSVTEVTLETDLTGWSTANQARIIDMLNIAPARVVVVNIDTTAAISVATDLIEANYQNGRVTTVGTSTDYTALCTWAKAKASYHALVFDKASQDSRYVENVYNQNVEFDSDYESARGDGYDRSAATQTTAELLPILCAVLSRANVNGASSTVIKALASVTDVSDANTVINNGNLIVYNDWRGTDRVVRLGTAVNSLTTFDTDANSGDQIEDMRYIEVSEAADMIRSDIKAVFRDNYSGQLKNSVDNQMQLLGAVGTYFDGLAADEILNSEYTNTVGIDIEAQREAWVTVNPEAASWDDDTVKSRPYKRQVFLTADVQILQSIQDLTMTIALN